MMENRLNILKRIEKGELSAEEAEKILKKSDARAERFLCDSCLYNQEGLELEEEKSFFN